MDVGYEGLLDWQVGRTLTCAGGNGFGNDDAEQDGEGEHGHVDGKGDDGGKSLIAPPMQGFFLQLHRGIPS